MMNHDVEEVRSKVSLVHRVLNELLTMLRQPEIKEGAIDYSPLFLILIPMVLGVRALVLEVEEMLISVYDRAEKREGELSEALYQRNIARNENEALKREVKTLRDRLYPPPDPSRLTDRVKFMATGVLMNGTSFKIEAIKQCRSDLNVGLADAKNLVEGFIASTDYRYYKSRVENYVKALRDDNSEQKLDLWETANRWQADLENYLQISDRVKFVACGVGSAGSSKIHAIKVAREEKGLSLADAKNAVESFLGSTEFGDYNRRVHDWLAARTRPKPDQVEEYATNWSKWLRDPRPLDNHEDSN